MVSTLWLWGTNWPNSRKTPAEIVGPKRGREGLRTGFWLMPGCIDDQVHFREPGLTHKAEIATESAAAAAGGITSFMEMPNTVPQALTQSLLQDKYDRAAEVSPVNYSFFMGASNHNSEVLRTDPTQVCGIKVAPGHVGGRIGSPRCSKKHPGGHPL